LKNLCYNLFRTYRIAPDYLHIAMNYRRLY
jgi:hypothetical protein